MHDDEVTAEDREIRTLLEAYPVPPPAPDFFDRALAKATHVGSRRQRNRWLATGFVSAMAAGLAFWMVGLAFLGGPDGPATGPEIPGVTMALEKPRTVNLVFSSATALDAAMLTVSLPAGIELQGFPGQREITWETSLSAGKNVLPLTLVALTPAGGELLARLEHRNRNRTFRLRVEIS